MKIKLILLLIATAFFFNLSLVSAADITVNGTTFKDIQNAIDNASDGDFIYLSNTTYTNAYTTNETHLFINKNLTISGSYSSSSTEHSTLNAANKSRVIEIGTGMNVTLIGLTLINGRSTNNGYGGGGAILNRGTLTLVNSDLWNNTVVTKAGAIYNSIGTLTIINSTIGNSVGPTDGGAIFNNQGNITIIGSTFINNKAGTTSNYGGAIANNQYGILTIKNSTFLNNNASGGGAIDNSGNLTIFDSTFGSNNASGILGVGGAINNKGNATITNSKFENNTASSGGVIYSQNNLIVLNSTFVFNKATSNGGSIYNMGKTNLTNNNFKNGAANNGGFVYNTANSVLILVGNTMLNGTATTRGKYVYNLGNAGPLNLTYLNNNTVPVNSGDIIKLSATLTDDMGNNLTGQNINFMVNGNSVGNVASIEGTASLNYTIPSNWIYNSYYSVNGSYTGSKGFEISLMKGTLKLGKLNTAITINPLTGKPGQTVEIHVQVKDENGNNVNNGTIEITTPDGQKITINIINGIGTGIWNISTSLTPGNYTNLTANYTGNSTYNPSNTITNATIEKLNTTITIDPIAGKPGQAITINVQVKDENGNNVNNGTIEITTPDGQKIIITISNGIGTGTWNIPPNLTPGNYTNITINYSNIQIYNPSNTNTTISIIKNINPTNTTDYTSVNRTNNSSTVNADSNTISMQKTGMPLTLLFAVVLMMFGGIFVNRKK